MERMETRSFNALAEQFLGARLPDALIDGFSFQHLPPDGRDFILRMLALMKRAEYPATEFNPLIIWMISAVTPRMLPSAWGGRIPPLTAPGRHRKLDAYVSRQTHSSGNGKPVFIDLGCGFPPATTADTARHLPDWTVFGVDRSFARYALYDADGDYACFNGDGEFEYFQPRRKPLHDNPRAARERFETLFKEMRSMLTISGEGAAEIFGKDGARLVCNPVQAFETENLKFIESDIRELRLSPAGAVRCMNVILYFPKSVRERMRAHIGTLLDDGGILITGFNHPFGIYARYAVYKKVGENLSPVEFAFSMDNLRPLGIGPWVTLADADEEAELLADLTAALRRDPVFWPDFNRRVDALQAETGVCIRGDDGFIQFAEDVRTAPPQAMMEKTAALWRRIDAEGYTDGAVKALRRAGYTAWKNPVGDIGVLPPPGALPGAANSRLSNV